MKLDPVKQQIITNMLCTSNLLTEQVYPSSTRFFHNLPFTSKDL